MQVYFISFSYFPLSGKIVAISVYICVCVFVCVCVYIYIHIYIYISNSNAITKKKYKYVTIIKLVDVAQTVKNLSAMWETWVRSLGWEDPLEKGKAAHSSILAWRTPRTEEPGGVQSTGLQSWPRLKLLNSSRENKTECQKCLISPNEST